MRVRALESGTLTLLLLAACAGDDAGDAAALADTTAGATLAATPPRVTATMRDLAGRELGTLSLAQAGDAIAVSGHLTGLAPGEHAIHLHATGRCEGPDFKSAGTHWNPTGVDHGSESATGPHFGDLRNISTDADSMAMVQDTTPGGTLSGTGAEALLDADGAAVIIHSGSDDYRSQPSGNAGTPVACGVVSAG